MTTTIGEQLAGASARFAGAGIDTPRVDAELLLAALLGEPRSRLRPDRPVPESVATQYGDYVTRRIAREPLQHITGLAPFRHIELAVGPGVFIPRPETELLVDAVLPRLQRGSLVLDLCAGSGALALSVADEAPGVRVVAVESSFAAGRWLARNAVGTDVEVVVGDVRDPELLRGLYGRADAVVSNPPYVPRAAEVAVEVLADPPEAVFAGPDGLDLLPTVVARAAQLLRPGGVFAVEHDDSHADAVLALVSSSGAFADIVGHRDLSGRPRYVTASRCGLHS